MKRWMIVFSLLILSLLLFSPALADTNDFCDPLPESLSPLLESVPKDCVVFSAPDGTTRAFLILDEGWSLQGYTLKDGQWILDTDSTPMVGHLDVYFVRHQAGQIRPDGSAYMDDQGFDIVSKSGPCQSYHWSGEYYTLCGWQDPARYAGTVLIDGTVLHYFPKGSQTPEYSINAYNELTLYSWTWSFDELPASPDEARKRAAILPDSIQNDFPGCDLVSYEQYNSGMESEAVFARVIEDKEKGGFLLQVIKAQYSFGQGCTHTVSLMDIPLSYQLTNTPAALLWTDMHMLSAEDTNYVLPETGEFTQEQAVDAAKSFLISKGAENLDKAQIEATMYEESDDQFYGETQVSKKGRRVWSVVFHLEEEGLPYGGTCHVDIATDGSVIAYSLPALVPMYMTGTLPDATAISEEQAVEIGTNAMSAQLDVPKDKLGDATAFYGYINLADEEAAHAQFGAHVWLINTDQYYALVSPSGTVIFVGNHDVSGINQQSRE